VSRWKTGGQTEVTLEIRDGSIPETKPTLLHYFVIFGVPCQVEYVAVLCRMRHFHVDGLGGPFLLEMIKQEVALE
jgi:hypothetical protein